MKIGQRVTPTGILLAPAGLPEDEWLALRRTGIGGSDVGSILGLNRYSTPWKLYLEKRSELPMLPRSRRLERAAMWGHRHEEDLAQVFCEETGFRTQRIGLIRHVKDRWRLANLDRKVLGCPDGPCFLEEKTRSQHVEKFWGESGDPAGVPDNEALQTYWYMGVNGYSHGHVAVLIGGNDDRFYRLERDEDLIADVTAICAEFWQRVLDGNPPPVEDSEAEEELLEHMWRATEGAAVELDPADATALRAQLEDLQQQAKDTEAAITLAKNQMRALLGDHEIGLVDGRPAVTWKRNGTFAVKRFREEQPELAAKYTHFVEDIDVEALKAGDPATYRQYRSRSLRLAGTTNRGQK